jgi:hypothetical protein
MAALRANNNIKGFADILNARGALSKNSFAKMQPRAAEKTAAAHR